MGSTDSRIAADIMGLNFIGPDAVEAHFRNRFNPPRWGELGIVPFSPRALELARMTYVLFPVPFGVSLNALQRSSLGPHFFNRGDTTPWGGHKFARRDEETGWRLVRKGEVPDSRSTPWTEQQTLLANGECVPSAALLALTTLLVYLVTKGGVWLFPRYVFTSDESDSGWPVLTGGRYDGLGISTSTWDGVAPTPGLSSEIMPSWMSPPELLR